MANRFIKSSIWTSRNLNRLSDKAELLFYRLLPLPDDFGCFNADPIDLRGMLFPRKPKWSTVVIGRQLTSLVVNKLIGLWIEDDRLYGIFWNWEKHQRCRSKYARKTPEPPNRKSFATNEHISTVCNYLRGIDIDCRQLTSLVADGGSPPSPLPPFTPPSSLNNILPDKSAPPKPKIKKPDPNHKLIIEHWMVEYEKKFKIKYGFDGGKDGQLIKTLLGQFGFDLLKSVITEFFNSDDQFIKNKTGFTIASLKLKANQVAQKIATPETPIDKLSPAGQITARNAQRVLERMDREDAENEKV